MALDPLTKRKSWNSSQKKVDKFITNEMYRKVASSRLSWLVAPPSTFRMFMKGKFDALTQRFQNIIVDRSTTCNFMVCVKEGQAIGQSHGLGKLEHQGAICWMTKGLLWRLGTLHFFF